MSNFTVTRGAVTEVMLSRPEVRNALNTETIQELLALFQDIGQDATVEVVVLTGAGDKAFCAGADLAEVRSLQTQAEIRQYFGNMARLIDAIHTLPQPVIGAAFGYVLAGGMGLAAGVDVLVASEDAKFGLPEVKVGLYPMVVTAPISRLIGARRTLELGLTGRVIDAATAEAWGFVNRVVPEGEALAEAHKVAEEIRQGSPVIAQLGKEGWRISQDMGAKDAMETLKNLVSLVAMTDDSREGVAAFGDKRKPEWPSRR